MTQAEATIREYVGILADMTKGMLRNPRHQSPHAFMLEHGKAWTVTEATYAGKRGTPKECYSNAGILVQRRPELTYVEGYVTTIGIPIPHAFLVNGAGEVIDPTLKDNDPEHGGRAYFGLAFDRTYHRAALVRSGYWALLDDLGAALKDIIHGDTEGMLSVVHHGPALKSVLDRPGQHAAGG
jgi:hypothetical protein